MRMLTFAKRCAREILRDPINLGFGLGFPLVLLVLLSSIQANIPVSLFEIDTLTPGITVFGMSFMTLFSATLIARDRESALLQVITDQQAFLADRQGKIVSTFSFDGLFVNRFANNKSGGMFLLLDQLGDGNQLQLISLDQGLDLLGSLNLKERVQDILTIIFCML